MQPINKTLQTVWMLISKYVFTIMLEFKCPIDYGNHNDVPQCLYYHGHAKLFDNNVYNRKLNHNYCKTIFVPECLFNNICTTKFS